MTGWTQHRRHGLADARDGAALVTAILVLLLLFTLVITATILSRQEVRIAANVSDTVRAKFVAEGGVNIGIAALNADLGTNRAVTSIARIMQTYYGPQWQIVQNSVLTGTEEEIPANLWMPLYAMEDTDTNLFIGGPAEEMASIVGRYVFAIVDEASKININVAGNPGVDPISGTYRHRSNEGVSPAEIDMGVLPDLDSDADGLAHRFPQFRFGADGGPGWVEKDDDWDNLFVSSDGIDNDGDGLIDELGEGIDEPDEFRLFNPMADDIAFKTIEQALLLPDIGPVTLDRLRPLITTASGDRAVIYTGVAEQFRLNLNLADAPTIAQTLVERRFGGDRAKAFQIAANIVDFRDKDSVPTQVLDETTGTFYTGVEPIRINEIMVRPVRRIEAETWFFLPQSLVDFWVENLAMSSDGNGNSWMWNPATPFGSGGFLEDPYAADFDGSGTVEPGEIHEVSLELKQSGLVPGGWYYVVLDLTDADGNVGADVQCDINYSGVWRTPVPDPSGVPGHFVVDANPATPGTVDPVLAPPIAVSLRKAATGVLPAYFNAVVLSQEPDMEWVELVNVGTHDVDVTEWQLHIVNGPVVDELTIGSYQLGDEVLIPAGGRVVLAIDNDDIFRGTATPADLARSIYESRSYDAVHPERMNAVLLLPYQFPLLQGPVFQDVWANATVAPLVATKGGDAALLYPLDDVFPNAPAGGTQVVELYRRGEWGTGRPADTVAYSAADVQDPYPEDGQPNLATHDFYRTLERANLYYPGRYEEWAQLTLADLDADGVLDDLDREWLVPGSRFGTPLVHNIRVMEASRSRGDFELVLPRVKNANFATVGELVDVPFYDPTWPPERFADPMETRPTTIGAQEVALIVDLFTTSALQLTLAPALGVHVEHEQPGWQEASLMGQPVYATVLANAEAVWRWDAYHGLERGVYDLYVLLKAGLDPDFQELYPDSQPLIIEAFTDRNDDGVVNTAEGSYDSLGRVGVEPDGVVAASDGILSYGTVEVLGYERVPGDQDHRDNDGDGAVDEADEVGFEGVVRDPLNIRIRNLTQCPLGDDNVLLRVVLTPRRRDYGKLNVNTVRNTDALLDAFGRPSNVLCALPGLLQLWVDPVPEFSRNWESVPRDHPQVGLHRMVYDALGAGLWGVDEVLWDTYIYGLEPSPDSTLEGVYRAARGRAWALAELRGEMPYTSSGNVLERMLFLLRYDPDRFAGDDFFALSGTTPLQRLNEALERFKRISNLITVRSDVFEIICLGQAGRVIDSNEDGILDLRYDEFIPVAEKKIRVVYER